MSIDERRENCKYYQKTVDDLKSAVFGNGSKGLKLEVQEVKTRLTILTTLQSVTMVAILSAAVKIIFFGGV